MSAQTLLIVESPAKAKTIGKYLGNNFKVLASFGHVRDLPKKSGSIDVEHDFEPIYQVVEKNKNHVAEIVKHAKLCDEVLLATDPDREGEAIAWHIAEILSKKGSKKTFKRVVFHEITPDAIKLAVNSPREIDGNLVNAQISRLTLDYLIGFNISPILWQKIKTGLSAGRVQSVALRLICERESEIKAFIPEDYFTISLATHKNDCVFNARLIEYAKNKIDTKTIKTQEEADNILKALQKHTNLVVSDIVKKQKKKNPGAPFITSSLQIEAAKRLSFAPDRTMKVAQTLYEGVEIGKETVGLITYMRTDSVTLSDTALSEIREFIAANYALEYLPANPNKYVSKVKNAQEAHEAIRPTSIKRTPDMVKKYLNPEQLKLYELIWLRTLASQFSCAILDTTSIDLSMPDGVFRANGVIISFDGFLKVYNEVHEDNISSDNESILPILTLEEKCPVDKIESTAHQTEPKPRYSEASLVKGLEELGIGRPSTYASIIATLKKREYVFLEKKRLIPTEIGMIVSGFLFKHLTKYVDYQFTANLEDTLDDISNGTTQKLPVLKKFWDDLTQDIAATKEVKRSDVVDEKLEENCPECGHHLLSKFGRYGRFIGCSNYPECKYIRKLENSATQDTNQTDDADNSTVIDHDCPKDGGKLVVRNGRYGKFISCSNYPKCKHIENIAQQTDDESVICPECKTGHIVAKKNRFGKMFYACNGYPKCKTLFNFPVVAKECDTCKYPVALVKTDKNNVTSHVCPVCSTNK